MKTVRITVGKSRARGYDNFIKSIDRELSAQAKKAIDKSVYHAAHVAMDSIASMAPGPRLAAYIRSIPLDMRAHATGFGLSLSRSGKYTFELKVSTDFYSSSVFNPAWGALITSYGRKRISASSGDWLVIPVSNPEDASMSKGEPIEFNYVKMKNSRYGAGFGSPSRDYARFIKEAGPVTGTHWIDNGLRKAHSKIIKTLTDELTYKRGSSGPKYNLGEFKGGGGGF